MSNSPEVEVDDSDRSLSIGEVSDLTGVSVATLRVWESRHGFPQPYRRASGHRRYSSDVVATVRDVVHRRERGMRLDVAILQARAADATPGVPALAAVPVRAESKAGPPTPPSGTPKAPSAAPAQARSSSTRPTEPGATSVYAHLRRTHPVLAPQRLTKLTLLAMSWAIEDEFLSRPQPGARVFGTFQRSRFYASAAPRWADLARTTASTHVFADFDRTDDETGVSASAGSGQVTEPVRVALPPASPLNSEWAVVCDGPHLPLALSAWELPGQHGVPDHDRTFEAVWTLDAHAVRGAARVCADAAAAASAPGASDACAALAAHAEPVEVDPQTVTSLFGRVVGYVDRR